MTVEAINMPEAPVQFKHNVVLAANGNGEPTCYVNVDDECPAPEVPNTNHAPVHTTTTQPPEVPNGSLPITGGDFEGMALFGGLALLGGLALSSWSRYRRLSRDS